MHTSFHLNACFHLFQSRCSLSEDGNKSSKSFQWATFFRGDQTQAIQTGILGAKNVHCGFSEPGGVPLKCLKMFLGKTHHVPF